MFDLKTDQPNTHIHTFNPTSHINERWANTNIESSVRRTSENYENYRNQNGLGLQLRPEDTTEDDGDKSGGDGVSSPPLWKNSYRYLSPNSRTQAIARGQWELMEMVKTMPESCYELSLRDLVEHQHRVKLESDEDCLVEEKIVDRKPSKGIKREEGKVKMVRSRSGDQSNHGGGLLLKMAFPFSLGARKKKKKNSGMNSFSRVSPRPEGLERSGKGGGGEKEWWKKRFSGSSGSESGGGGGGGGSRGSSSSSGRKMGGCLPGCWSFLTERNKKASN